MPSLNSIEHDPIQQQLIDLFNSLQLTNLDKPKVLDLLYRAKLCVLNQMTKEQIFEFFVTDKNNFTNLFLLNIWTSDLEKSNGIVDFTEPYEILEKLFASFDSLDNFVNLFHSQIKCLLEQTRDEKIKHICAKHLIRLAKTTGITDQNAMLTLKELMPLFVKQIPKTTVSYTQLLGQLFCSLTNSAETTQMLIEETNETVIFKLAIFENNPGLVKEMEIVAKINSVNSFRIFEIIIALACCSNDHLIKLCEQEFKLSEKIEFYLNNKRDVLAQLNCIELLFSLAKTNHGYEYMNNMGYLNKFVGYLRGQEDELSSSFLIPSIVKLFSHLARIKFGTFNCAEYYDFLFKQLLNNELEKTYANSYLNLTLQTWTYLFELNYVVETIYKNYETQILMLVNKLAWIVKNLINEEVKSNALLCISTLLAIDASLLHTDQTDLKWTKLSHAFLDQYSKLSYFFYQTLASERCSNEKFFSLVLNLAKQPFVETRLAAQAYFKALAQTTWGLNAMLMPNEYNKEDIFFNGYLLNRSIELEKIGLESKYELIKLIHVNLEAKPDLIHLIHGEMNFHKLKKYIQEGPFYTKVESKVAFESF